MNTYKPFDFAPAGIVFEAIAGLLVIVGIIVLMH